MQRNSFLMDVPIKGLQHPMRTHTHTHSALAPRDETPVNDILRSSTGHINLAVEDPLLHVFLYGWRKP